MIYILYFSINLIQNTEMKSNLKLPESFESRLIKLLLKYEGKRKTSNHQYLVNLLDLISYGEVCICRIFCINHVN